MLKLYTLDGKVAWTQIDICAINAFHMDQTKIHENIQKQLQLQMLKFLESKSADDQRSS